MGPAPSPRKTVIKNIGGITKESDIPEHLNNHFCSVGENIQSNIQGNAELSDFEILANPPIFDLNPVKLSDISTVIDDLKSSQSCSIDGITANLLKIANVELLPVLQYLFNLSISTKHFPDCWKIATVTPPFKSSNTEDCNNCCPISVLPTIGKVLKWLISNQCKKYMNDNALFTLSQAGFREGHSMGACLVDFLNEIYEEVDNGGTCGVCSSWTWPKHLIQ